MHLLLICLGKTEDAYVQEILNEYSKRISRYVSFEILEIPSPKKSTSLGRSEYLSREAELVLKKLDKDHFVILLDERGKEMRSAEFASLLNQRFLYGGKRLTFLIGGAFGVDARIKERADLILSLSRMTFPHQLVRIIFAEQLYRALSIIRNEAYHHE